MGLARDSEKVLLSIIRVSGLAQSGGASGSFHRQDHDQESLVQMAVIELGSFSEDVGQELISGLQFVQNGRFEWHGTEGKGLRRRAV